jgi:hypothetical protein
MLLYCRQSMSREEGILVVFILLLWMVTLTIFFQRWGKHQIRRPTLATVSKVEVPVWFNVLICSIDRDLFPF